MSITAILDAGVLQGKTKLYRVERTVDVILQLPLHVSGFLELTASADTNYKLARFEWREQISKYKHRYTLKSIE